MGSPLSRPTALRVLVAVAVGVLVLGASACGGGKKSSVPSATLDWAGGVCTAFTTWKDSLEGIKTNLTEGGLSNLSSSALTQAGNDAKDATHTFVESLDTLGAPDTAKGAEARSNLTTLENSLTDSMNAIEAAIPKDPSVTDILSALPTVKTEFTKMANDLTTAVDKLKDADPGSELEQAFQEAPSCSPYFAS